ncbi:MAG TPA: RNA polymerase sigma factor [Planctomycetaceae bacterium]|jgi:RNA polymerase sigma-70 factor (ECF subfamily)|nr:RNA polymerase sigma factor [Planctomycetaceae bacterium]
MTPSDVEIMRRIQGGEVELFDLLVARYRSALLRVAWSKLGNAAWAEDVVQETLLAAFAARGSYKPQFAFRTWLWTILLNLCRRQWQRREGRPREQSCSGPDAWNANGAAEPSTGETGLAHALRTERREHVHQLLLRLPEAQADALRLRFLAELPFAEIALTMGSSLSAAKQRVRHGLLSLATLLRDETGDER